MPSRGGWQHEPPGTRSGCNVRGRGGGGGQRIAASDYPGGCRRPHRRRQRCRRSVLRNVCRGPAPSFGARSCAVRQPAAAADRPGAGPRRRRQRISRRSRHAAQSRRAHRRSSRRAARRAHRPCRRDAAGAHACGQDGPATHAPRCRALGDRACRNARARDQESVVRDPRRRAAARTVRRRRGPGADAADLRRGGPDREARRPHGSIRATSGRSNASRSTSMSCSNT